jgi:hypothetical protein
MQNINFIEQEYVRLLNDQNDFNRWNYLKQNFEHYYSQPEKFPKEGEVWMSAFGKNIDLNKMAPGKSFQGLF